MSGPIPVDERTEWLEADGLGGFASGTTAGVRTRRYHALLLAATTPPTGRMVLVNGLDAWLEPQSPGAPAEFLTRQSYAPGVVAPEDGAVVEGFADEPWPAWTFRLRDGTRIEHSLFVPQGLSVVALRWRVTLGRAQRAKGAERNGLSQTSPSAPFGAEAPQGDTATLAVRPFLSGRDSHALHHRNPAFRFDADTADGRIGWRPYDGVPGVTALSNGRYTHDPQWYQSFWYEEERARGLDFEEDLAAPGIIRWNLAEGDALLLLGTPESLPEGAATEIYPRLRRSERARRARFGTRLERAGDAYLVKRGSGRTIVAGYPWFTDWGRDTFISLRGLCLATGRLSDARSILLEWAGLVSEGMLPNRFVDQGDAPEYNTVDASLWYVVAVYEYIRALEARGRSVPARDRRVLDRAVQEILAGHIRGTRYGIRLADDGLLSAGEPGVQLTWMDAKVGDWVVTPRVGKPVEIQALWLNALRAAGGLAPEYLEIFERGRAAFEARFWNPAHGCLYDVVDADHVPGRVDASIRPNQILAVGGLPYSLLQGERAGQVVDTVERLLWTPRGLRTLAPGAAGYQPHYQGDMRSRDGAYHQGTVWPWLLGPFVEAWLRVQGGGAEARERGRRRYLEPLQQHLDQAGVGHLSEIADAEPPHTPRGCPFQAWSVAEILRLDLQVLAGEPASRAPAGAGV